MFTYLDHLKDDRVSCYSVLLKIKISDYLSFIEGVYQRRGGLEGQRAPLKTKSAQRIRRRLIEDLSNGTVIPPIVIGIRLDHGHFTEFEKDIPKTSITIFPSLDIENQVSIIDGMQRTTALFEALKLPKFEKEKDIRVELWVAESTNSLIYRMLVLNSGQIPWNIKRQLEVVFSQLTKELEVNIKGLELYTSDEPNSRSRAGQYQASQFIELFMLFGMKRVNIDIQEEVAAEFARLDIIDTSGNECFMAYFYKAAQSLVNLDMQFSRLDTITPEIELSKFKTGKNIFSSQPARAGFIVALSQYIFGLPGVEYPIEVQEKKFVALIDLLEKLVETLSGKNQEGLTNFLDLPTLDEQVNIKTSKVGEFERNFFLKSFKTFIELLELKSLSNLTPCWRTSY